MKIVTSLTLFSVMVVYCRGCGFGASLLDKLMCITFCECDEFANTSLPIRFNDCLSSISCVHVYMSCHKSGKSISPIWSQISLTSISSVY